MNGLNGWTDTLTAVSASLATVATAASPYINNGSTSASAIQNTPGAQYINANANTPPPAVNNTTTYILLGVGVLVVGGVIFAVAKKKKK